VTPAFSAQEGRLCKIMFFNWLYSWLLNHSCFSHKHTVWGCRGCSRIPYAGELAINRAKIFNMWANHTATFTFKLGRVYFAINGKSSAETILPFFLAFDGKVDTAFI